MRLRQIWARVVPSVLVLSSVFSVAQGPRPRLAAAIGGGNRVTLPGTRPAFAEREGDTGALPAGTPLKGISLVFSRTAAQQTELDALLAAQQDPTSPLYHHWLTPDQFGARFGVADADIAKVEAWLTSQGFQVDEVSRSRNRVKFDGTAGQVAAAFGAELHRYSNGSATWFAPAQDLSVPAALAPLVLTVSHLSQLHPHSHVRVIPRPRYTSAQTGNEFLTPGDVATMYNVSSTYKAGFNGAGQSIAVLGQSYMDTSAISAFQSGAGLTPNAPTLVLIPDTGVPGVNALEDGDEEESQLDVEYASGMAPGAKVFLVYTGDAVNSGGVFESLTYAVEENIAPIISGSYGVCETDLQNQGSSVSTFISGINATVQQASAQGQSIIFSAGDNGSTDCFADGSVSAAQRTSLAVDFPASEPGITAMGGLQMQTGTYFKTGGATGNSAQYWQSATGSDVVSSLLSYVPEAVWNEDSAADSGQPISAGGGGISALFPRPTWQTGVAGIPAGTNRVLPDVALQASTGSPGYVFCTTDPSGLAAQGVTASCSSGLRGPSGLFTVAGGTSFAAPVMAGLVAVLNQAKGAAGQGSLNPTLYGLATNSATYASVFHDITTGTNACTAGNTYCSTSGASSYAATAGFDPATGLGSFDFGKLVAAWPSPAGASATVLPSTTTLTAATLTPASGATDALTISVAGAAGGATPTGTVTLLVDGDAAPVAVTLTLTNGQATYTYPGATQVGSHPVVATYSGDGNYLPSKGTVVLTLSGSANVSGSFTLSAQNISLPYNSQGTGAVTVVPGSGYSGTVVFSLSYPSNAPTLCYTTTSAATGASNVTTNTGKAGQITATLTLYEGTQCGSAANLHTLPGTGPGKEGKPARHPWLPLGGLPGGIAFAGLLGVGLLGRRSRRIPTLLSLTVLAGLGIGLSGCGGNSGSNTTGGGGGGTTTPTTQTLTVTLKGTDSVNSSLTSSTTFTVTVHP